MYAEGWEDRRDSKSFVVVDEDCGIPISVVESYRGGPDNGHLDQSDPRSLLLSMSEYGKPQNYVQEYPATRPEQGTQDFSYGAHHTYSAPFMSTQVQVPSGLPQVPLMPHAQHFGTHDQIGCGPHSNPQFPTYMATGFRQVPEITSYRPSQGNAGTNFTVSLRSPYDLEAPPITLYILFGQKRCDGVLTKVLSAQSTEMYEYTISATVPPLSSTESPSPTPLHLVLDNSTVTWEAPSLEFGSFTYTDSPVFYSSISPDVAPRKRKLSLQASPRRSPVKRATSQQVPRQSEHISYLPNSGPPLSTDSSFRQPSYQDVPMQSPRFSPNYQQNYGMSGSTTQATPFYGVPADHSALSIHPQSSSPWGNHASGHFASRSPASTMASAERSSQPMQSSTSSAPPLIRTSIMQSSPTAPTSMAPTSSLSTYSMYPPNSKASLRLIGELNSMTSEKWTPTEREARRRLVQFRRTQTGSIISATFEPVTLEARIPNSICVSCIYWEERKECYVTSVDTISLLESLVAVRFTVEEKNRIRRNLEGFRPATVSKTKADSEEFFKLIMGFPSPKPRNIEKDVKVFPWRILATALKKIISKYSASYSSTAGMMHTPVAPTYTTTGEYSLGPGTSPRSGPGGMMTTYGHNYAPNSMRSKMYPSHAAASAGLGIGPSAGQLDLRAAVPTTAAGQATSWHQPALQYISNNTATSSGGDASWDLASYTSASPLTALPATTPPYQIGQQHRYPTSLNSQALRPETRFVPLPGYEDHSRQQTNTR